MSKKAPTNIIVGQDINPDYPGATTHVMLRGGARTGKSYRLIRAIVARALRVRKQQRAAAP